MKWPWSRVEERVPTGKAFSRRQKEEASQVVSDSKWTDIWPHPKHLAEYSELNKDPEVSTAITVLNDMTVGVGIYTQMPEPHDDEHSNKKKVDTWNEDNNLDEMLKTVNRTRIEYGFCPVERLNSNKYKILQPEYFWIHRDKKGNTTKYSQRLQETGSEIASWEKTDQIILFVRKETPSQPYGEALVEPIVRQLKTRNEVNEELPDVVGNIAYPFRVIVAATEAIRDTFYDTMTNRETYENAFIANVQEGEYQIHDLVIDPRFNPTPMLEHMDFEISEGLFAPLLMYLRNATEASATKMLEAISRHIEGEQRYIKRRVERFIFKPLTGEPVPRLMWGAPEPQMEEVSLTDLSSVIDTMLIRRAMTVYEARKLLRNYVPLEEGDLDNPDYEPPMPPQLPFTPPALKNKPALDLSLQTVEDNYKSGKWTLTETFKEASHILDVYMQREKREALRLLNETLKEPVKELSEISEEHFKHVRYTLFSNFRARILPASPVLEDETEFKGSKYTVIKHE